MFQLHERIRQVAEQLQTWLNTIDMQSISAYVHITVGYTFDAIKIGEFDVWDSENYDHEEALTFEACQAEFRKQILAFMPFLEYKPTGYVHIVNCLVDRVGGSIVGVYSDAEKAQGIRDDLNRQFGPQDYEVHSLLVDDAPLKQSRDES